MNRLLLDPGNSVKTCKMLKNIHGISEKSSQFENKIKLNKNHVTFFKAVKASDIVESQNHHTLTSLWPTIRKRY